MDDLDGVLQNHILQLGSDIGFFEDLGGNHLKDVFGVIWDRTIDKDIGSPIGYVIQDPSLEKYTFPDPLDQRYFDDIERKIENKPDLFRVFEIGFSRFGRAWTLRGMENLLMDFILHPEFVQEFLQEIADYNIAQINKAMKYDIDAVYLGDDWGQQRGLIMGYEFWKQYIYPQLERMYKAVRMVENM